MTIKETSRLEYQSRINRVIDYIDTHLGETLSLQKIAAISHFSPFHFHRIFTFMTGETPLDYIQRIRIEKAASRLFDKKGTISEISYDYGFGSPSLFSRTFRKYFGMSPSEFRQIEKPVFSKNGTYFSKNGQWIRKKWKTISDKDSDFCRYNFKPEKFIFMEAKIEVKEMPEMQVIYCRHIGPFHLIGKAYEKVMKWAAPRGLFIPGESKTMTVTHDDPTITEIDKVRQSASIVVYKDVKTEGEIGKMKVPGGKYAVGRFEIGTEEFEKAWNSMCSWFIDSGYQQERGVTYELYHNDHTRHPQKKHIVDICIPVKPL